MSATRSSHDRPSEIPDVLASEFEAPLTARNERVGSVEGVAAARERCEDGKPDHEPAGFTVLNFVVADIDVAVDELNAAGVVTKIYRGDEDFGTDERGIAHGRAAGMGPDICWFRDPAGNVLSVLQP